MIRHYPIAHVGDHRHLAAWDAVEAGEMELTVINPGAVFGPSLGAHMDGQSVAMMTSMIGGKPSFALRACRSPRPGTPLRTCRVLR